MPVVAATPVRVNRRRVRTRFNCAPTPSSTAAIAGVRVPALTGSAPGSASTRSSHSPFPGTATIVGAEPRRGESEAMSQSQYDVAVVGGGAAGLSAALVLSRARRKVLVVDAGEPRNAPAAHMHGYLSRDGLPPRELLCVGRDEVRGYGGLVEPGTVTDLH